MLDLTAFRLRYPEFDSVADPTVQLAIDDAIEDLNQNKCSASLTDRITAALAAHYLTLDQKAFGGDSGTVAPVASQSVGEVSVTYAINADKGTDVYYNSTSYGQKYLSLLRKCFSGMVTFNGQV